MNILYCFADNPSEWNCSEWRCAIPARAIGKLSGHSAQLLYIGEFANQTPRAREACDHADVIVVQRILYGQVLDAVRTWRQHGKVVVAEFDDAYQLMSKTNPGYPFWGMGVAPMEKKKPDGVTQWARLDPHPLDEFKRGLQGVAAATVPSRLLASDWEGYAQMYYLPNYLDMEKYIFVPKRSHDDICIGWGGGGSHQESLRQSGVLEALGRVCAQRPKVRVIIAGADLATFDLVPVPRERKTHLPWVEFKFWPETLAQFDIGVAPLYGPYDQRRSWIKALEYMIMKIPWVASSGAPYEDLGLYGALIENHPDAWTAALLEIVDHIDDYRIRAEGPALLQAMMLSVDVNVDRILKAYGEIMTLAPTGQWDQREPRIRHGHEVATLGATD